MTASTATAVQAILGEVSANEFHRRSVAALHAAEVPFLIGGAYMVEVCGGVSRSTKDFDLYVRPNHAKAALRALARAGYKTELTFPHWLAKATYEGDIVDLIFRAGNGLCEVDDSWFDRARDDEQLVRRFGPDWRVLLSHLVLFGYIYPGERARIPAAIMEDLLTRLRSEARTAAPERLCRGTLLSRKQYLVDVQKWGFRDARLEERVHMNEKDIADWTDAIEKEE